MRKFLFVLLPFSFFCFAESDNDLITTELHDVRSEIRNETVPVSVILPPGFSMDSTLPLLINLHGGGGSRRNLIQQAQVYEHMFKEEIIPPMIVVSFSSGPISYYHGTWEDFVIEELPNWAKETYGALID